MVATSGYIVGTRPCLARGGVGGGSTLKQKAVPMDIGTTLRLFDSMTIRLPYGVAIFSTTGSGRPTASGVAPLESFC